MCQTSLHSHQKNHCSPHPSFSSALGSDFDVLVTDSHVLFFHTAARHYQVSLNHPATWLPSGSASNQWQIWVMALGFGWGVQDKPEACWIFSASLVWLWWSCTWSIGTDFKCVYLIQLPSPLSTFSKKGWGGRGRRTRTFFLRGWCYLRLCCWLFASSYPSSKTGVSSCPKGYLLHAQTSWISGFCYCCVTPVNSVVFTSASSFWTKSCLSLGSPPCWALP